MLVNDLLFGLLFIHLGWVGDYLDEHPMGYSCPLYCGVVHTHYRQPPDGIEHPLTSPSPYKSLPSPDCIDCLSISSESTSDKP